MNVHRLLWDTSRDDLGSIVDYVDDGFDITELWRGEQISTPEQLDQIKLITDRGQQLPDVVGNPLSWQIVSDRFKNHLLEIACEQDVQFIPVTLTESANEEFITGFHVMNVVKCLPGLDREKSSFSESANGRIRSVSKFTLRSENLGMAHIFRLEEFKKAIFFSDTLAQSLVGKRFTGIAFLRCDLI